MGTQAHKMIDKTSKQRNLQVNIHSIVNRTLVEESHLVAQKITFRTGIRKKLSPKTYYIDWELHYLLQITAQQALYLIAFKISHHIYRH
jgi:hypothetical protein